MAPTRMKLRVRRRDNAAGGAGAGAGGGQPEEGERGRESGGRSSRRKNTNNTATTATATSSSSPPTSSASASAWAVMAAEEASPDSKCPICLDRFNNLAYLDRCLHRFCFPCIQEWSHNKAECPLCKQPFTSILHSVRAEDDFKEYTLRPAPADSSVAATVAMVAAMASAARNDHQMRLTLRRHRADDGGETTTRRRRRERGGRGGASRRAGERTGVWEWYLDSHPLPHLPHHSTVSTVSPIITEDSDESEGVVQQRIREAADLEERGVIFEGLTGLGGAVTPVTPSDRASRQLMTRLAARQRQQREGGTVRRLRDREMVAFRRALYRCGIRVRGVAGVSGNQGQQQNDVSAESFRRNPAHLNRLRPWLRRELTVLYGAHGVLVDIVQRIIMARLARHGLEDTPTIEEELRPFLLARTDHFLHELVSFARSPLSLDSYDMQAVYEPLTAALELDGISSSSDSSSVIAISEGEEEERQEKGRPEERLQESTHDNISQSGSCLSLTGWDDETPGPSYSTAEPSCSLASLPFSPAMQDAANEELEEKREEDGEECQIVGYKKPIAERTPELVQLSSDSEDDNEEKKKKVEEKVEEELPLLPPTSTPLSGLPTIPPSTSGTYREEQGDRLKEKDGEEGRQRSNTCSWLGTYGRSQESVFTLSPSERQRESWRDRKQSSNEAVREKRKRRRRGQERSGDWRKSGTLYNPNRSIYPAMMRHRSRSPSPFHSSGDSGPLSPPDSSWEYHGSPLSSFVSSHSSSSSPLCSSPQPSPPPQTPPTPSLSPSNPHHGEKPGGKRKYKSRHLDSTDKDPTWRPSSSSHHREKKRKRGEKERRRRGRDGGRRRERHRRDIHRESVDYGGESSSSRRCREDRSPSVEIIYEGTITSNAVQPPSRKRHRKRHRKTQHSSSPVIITLDSDSSHDDLNRNVDSSSSSPLSSQQTVDFSDLLPLPLVRSAGVGGVLDAEISELPVDILDRGSDGSETEPVGRSKAAGPIAIDNSDNEVDVVNTDESGLLLGCDEADKELSSDTSEPIREAGTKPLTAEKQRRAVTADCSSQPTGENVVMVDVHKNDADDFTSDRRLLETILNDLKGTAAPNCDLPLNFEHSSPDTRKKHCRDQDSWLAERRHPNPSLPEERWSNDFRNQNRGLDSLTCCTNIPQLPRLEQLKEGRDVPPVLKQDSPVQSRDRNMPLPLKHTDAGSVHLPPSSPVDLHSPYASHLNSYPTISPADSHSAAELPKDNKPIPPISTLKRHFTSTLALRGMMPPTSEVSPHGIQSFCHIAPTDSHCKVGAVTNTIHSTSPVSPIDSHSSSVSKNSFTSSDRFSSFHSPGLNSDSAAKEKSGSRSSSSELLPLNPLPSVDFRSSRTGWSTEKAAHSDSTSRGCRNKTLGPKACSAVPSDLHPGSSVSAHGTPAGSFLFSGVGSNDTLPPVPVPPVDPRTQNTHSPIDSQFSNKRAPLSKRFGISSTTAPSSRSSPTDTHSVGPKSAFDHHPSTAAEELRNSNVSSPVNHENRMLHPPPIDLYCSPAPPVHLHSSGFTSTSVHSHFNHTALSPPPTIAFHTSHRQCSAQAKPNTGSNSKRLCSTDSEPHNHFDDSSAPPFPIDTYSKRNLPMDSQCGSQALVDFHPKNSREDFQLHMDNHIRSSPRPVENQWKSNSSTDARSDSQSPVDEQSASSMWTTHRDALSQRTQK